jgi:hypothetical protein
MQRKRSAGAACCTLGGGRDAIIRVRAGEWLQRPVYGLKLSFGHQEISKFSLNNPCPHERIH